VVDADAETDTEVEVTEEAVGDLLATGVEDSQTGVGAVIAGLGAVLEVRAGSEVAGNREGESPATFTCRPEANSCAAVFSCPIKLQLWMLASQTLLKTI
jgi:hypothetical protein